MPPVTHGKEAGRAIRSSREQVAAYLKATNSWCLLIRDGCRHRGLPVAARGLGQLQAVSARTIHVARDQSRRRFFFSNEQADPIYLEGHTIRLCIGIEACRVGQFG